MAWDFETDPEYQAQLDWADEFVRDQMIMGAAVMGIADRPTEVHKVTVARQVLRDYHASDDLWPVSTSPSAWPRRGPSTPNT
jgi:hypothetical protein